MKKTFENWLVVSDIDGTLHNKMRKLPSRNYEVIKKFTDLGGNFTLATGRTVSSLVRPYGSVPANQPAVILNGAGVYDMKKQRLLHSRPIGEKGMKFVRDIIERYNGTYLSVDVAVYCADMIYVVKNGILSHATMMIDKSPHTFVRDIDSIPQSGWMRVMFWGMPKVIEFLTNYITSVENPDANFMLSSPVTIEMLQKDTHKGVGVMELARDLGIKKDHVAAIGDYFNDWDMLKTVGLPACAGQAPKKIQQICKFKACHCNQGCVADLLEFIMYRNGGLPE